MLLRLAERIRGAAEELAPLESRNVGKPIQEARGEVEMGAACFQYYAGLIPRSAARPCRSARRAPASPSASRSACAA